MFLKLYVAAMTRMLGSDRGEGPVPYIILVGAMAALAVAIIAIVRPMALGIANNIQPAP